MFVLVNQGKVIAGPYHWDKINFQQQLYSRLEIEYPLPYVNSEERVIHVNQDVSIWPVKFKETPAYNVITEYLDGPFYEFDDRYAYSYRLKATLPFDAAKAKRVEEYKNTRLREENEGVEYQIGEVNYLIPTSKEERASFFYGIAGNWKLDRIFTEEETTLYRKEWVVINDEQLGEIRQAIQEHVQTKFDLEKQAIDLLEQCETVDDIVALVESAK